MSALIGEMSALTEEMSALTGEVSAMSPMTGEISAMTEDLIGLTGEDQTVLLGYMRHQGVEDGRMSQVQGVQKVLEGKLMMNLQDRCLLSQAPASGTEELLTLVTATRNEECV